MDFELPEELPTGIEELNTLLGAAQDEFNRLRGLVEGGQTLTDDEVEVLRYVVEAIETVRGALATAEEAQQARQDEINALISQGEGGDEDSDEDDPDADEDSDEDDPDAAEDVVAEAEQITEDAAGAVVAAGRSPAKRNTFSSVAKGRKPNLPARQTPSDVGFRMDPSAPGYTSGLVDFRKIAESIDSVRPGSRMRGTGRSGPITNYTFQTLFRLGRNLKVVDDSHELVAEIERATDISQLRAPQFDAAGSLTAAGGWCAPSEQLYDFCEVPTATDLISLPEITIRRGGVRWPVEPDLSAIFDSFEFFFTEPELEADPPPVKECVEIPCPDEFVELRLNAVGYCVEAGILQAQGWPELIEWFMRSLTQEHFRALSRRTILDMVAGSTPVTIPADSQLAAGSAVLNSIELMAVNLRLQRGLGRTAPIEGVAPNWLHAVIRADLANQQGVDTKNITDAQINGWFSARNIAFQFVADWQTRGVGQPGHLETTQWPGTVQVLLYPAGTWFRALDNVIQFGVLYPRELLQINRFTMFFTEDAYAVGKRCNESLVVTIPICPNGAYGAQDEIVCNTPANEVQQIAITGVPTGGTFTLTWNGQTTAAIAYNANSAAVQAALLALPNLDSGDVTVTGGALPGTPVVVTFGGTYSGVDVPTITANGSALTGGTDPAVVVTVTVEGGS